MLGGNLGLLLYGDVFVMNRCDSTILSNPTIRGNHRHTKRFRVSPSLLICGLLLHSLCERLRTHNFFFTKDQCFYLNYHKFSIKSYVLDVY